MSHPADGAGTTVSVTVPVVPLEMLAGIDA
jgi:hypothetical protein